MEQADPEPTQHMAKNTSHNRDKTTKATSEQIDSLPNATKMLLHAAQTFLMDDPITRDMLTMNHSDLIEELQQRFQRHLERYYEQSGLQQKVIDLCSERTRNPTEEPLDEAICHLIAQNSQDDGTWMLELPALLKTFHKKGYNCTLGSALLQTALQEVGIQHVHTVLRTGHYIVLHELNDGSIKILDPTSLMTTNKGTPKERLVGYVRTFSPSQIINRREIAEPGNRRSFSFTVQDDKPDHIGGITHECKGHYEEHFYANDPSIKIDISIALENLSEIKDDAKRATDEHSDQTPELTEKYLEAKTICERSPQLYDLDFAMLKRHFKLMHGYDQIRSQAS